MQLGESSFIKLQESGKAKQNGGLNSAMPVKASTRLLSYALNHKKSKVIARESAIQGNEQLNDFKNHGAKTQERLLLYVPLSNIFFKRN